MKCFTSAHYTCWPIVFSPLMHCIPQRRWKNSIVILQPVGANFEFLTIAFILVGSIILTGCVVLINSIAVAGIVRASDCVSVLGEYSVPGLHVFEVVNKRLDFKLV